MNNEQINQLIQGIGMMTELYLITFSNFKKQNLSDEDAIRHTKAFMSVMMETFTDPNSKNNLEEK